jgi:hypothetical protein
MRPEQVDGSATGEGDRHPRPNDRRHFLRSVAAATGVVWAAPVVTSLGVPAYAQASPPPDPDILERDLERPEGTDVLGTSLSRPGGLPVTGGPGLVGIVAAGAGAMAAGAAAVRASNKRREVTEGDEGGEVADPVG